MAVLVVDIDDDAAATAVSALGASASRVADPNTIRSQVSASGAKCVVIGASIAAPLAKQITTDVKAANPLARTVWIRERLETQGVLSAVRDGAADVVAVDALEDLVLAVARALRDAAADGVATGAASHPELAPALAVFSPKGGVGKTTIATSLSAQLAHERGLRVALIDLDLEFGDVQIHFALKLHHSITDLSAESLDEHSLAAAMLRHDSGVAVLAAPPNPELAETVTVDLIERVIDQARRMFDVVIIDCPPTLNETVLTAFDNCSHIAVITTPDVAALKNVATSLRALQRLGTQSDISLLLNMARPDVGCSAEDVEHALAQHSLPFTVAAQFPVSPDLQAATNAGHLAVLADPQGELAVSLRSWAVTNLPLPAPESLASTQRARRRLGMRSRKAAVSA